jgi:hypothetical protein
LEELRAKAGARLSQYAVVLVGDAFCFLFSQQIRFQSISLMSKGAYFDSHEI